MYTTKKIKDFKNEVDSVGKVIDYCDSIIQMDYSLERIEMDSDNEGEVELWKNHHQISADRAKAVFAKMTVRDISFCAQHVVTVGEPDGGSLFVVIRKK